MVAYDREGLTVDPTSGTSEGFKVVVSQVAEGLDESIGAEDVADDLAAAGSGRVGERVEDAVERRPVVHGVPYRSALEGVRGHSVDPRQR